MKTTVNACNHIVSDVADIALIMEPEVLSGRLRFRYLVRSTTGVGAFRCVSSGVRVVSGHAVAAKFVPVTGGVSRGELPKSPHVGSLDKVSFFFQAEDGIRDDLVTGVQTCALPI